MGKYIHKFNSVQEFDSAALGNTDVWLSYTEGYGITYSPQATVYNNSIDYVDLGLPSKTMWATSEYPAAGTGPTGGVPWGMSAKPKHYANNVSYNYVDVQLEKYVFYDSNTRTYTKYNDTDGNTNLTDGGNDYVFSSYAYNSSNVYNSDSIDRRWRIPTVADAQELIENTTQEWIIDNENYTHGCKFYSKTNDASLFMQACGYWMGTSYTSDTNLYVWLADLDTSNVSRAYCLVGNSNTPIQIQTWMRYNALHIYPVICPARTWYNKPLELQLVDVECN